MHVQQEMVKVLQETTKTQQELSVHVQQEMVKVLQETTKTQQELSFIKDCVLSMKVPLSRSVSELGHVVQESLHECLDRTLSGADGEDPILTATQMEFMQSLQTEKEMVGYLFPFLSKLLEANGRCIVSSEDHVWLPTSSTLSKFQLKPDLFVCNAAFYEKKPFDGFRPQVVRGIPFGEFYSDAQILDAKLHFSNQALGELATHAEHLSAQCQNKVVRTALITRSSVWLMDFILQHPRSRLIIPRWDLPGSAKAFASFFRAEHPIGAMVNRACEDLKCNVERGEAFLGAGATGYVFKVRFAGEADCRALKVVELAHALALEQEHAKLASSPDDCVVKPRQSVSWIRGDGSPGSLFVGACMVLKEVGQPCSKSAWIHALKLLAKLHSAGVGHGDPRYPNLLQVGPEAYRWCDLRGASVAVSASGMSQDVMNLLKSFLGEHLSFAAVVPIIEAYSDKKASIDQVIEAARGILQPGAVIS